MAYGSVGTALLWGGLEVPRDCCKQGASFVTFCIPNSMTYVGTYRVLLTAVCKLLSQIKCSTAYNMMQRVGIWVPEVFGPNFCFDTIHLAWGFWCLATVRNYQQNNSITSRPLPVKLFPIRHLSLTSTSLLSDPTLNNLDERVKLSILQAVESRRIFKCQGSNIF
jgi:hypothetical protein